MTWAEFKAELERQGVTEDMDVDVIDTSYPSLDTFPRVDIDKAANSFTIY